MAIKITDECINCGACEPEQPIMQFKKGVAGNMLMVLL